MNNKKYRFKLDQIWVKSRDGTPMVLLTLPWIMEHLLTDKAAGPAGEQYEHYKCMPYEYVAMLVDSALNGRLPQPVQKVWQMALVYAGDKQ